jgi:hypothetical protein
MLQAGLFLQGVVVCMVINIQAGLIVTSSALQAMDYWFPKPSSETKEVE